jgi:hypothetical protein
VTEDDALGRTGLITLGGRAFRVIDFDRRTIPLHLYLETQMRESGADKVLPGPEEGDESWALRLRMQLVDSGRAIDLVAGCLVAPEQSERDWSPAVAAATAAHLRQCDAAEALETFDQLALAVALRFFMQAVERLQRFRNSLPAPTPLSPPQDRRLH